MAGRPKRRARLAKMVAAHKGEIHKGRRKCKKCGKRHSLSSHWSHTHGDHRGAKGESAWFGRKKRPQGRKRRKSGTTKRRRVSRGPTAAMRRRGSLAFAAAVRKGNRHKKHLVRGHLAKTPGSSKKHRVKAHLAKVPVHHRKKTHRKKARKGHRSAAQKAATARMLAGLAAKRAGRKVGKTHLVAGHLAKTPGSRKKHRVKAHRAANPGAARAVAAGLVRDRKGFLRYPKARKGKSHRSPAQKAATARMLAAARARRGASHDIRGSHRPRLG